MGDQAPGVSVFMAVRDEEQHIVETVEAVLAQDHAGPLEVVVACGPSRDRTRELLDGLAARHPGRVTVVDNPTGLTAAGLNAALAATRHDVLVRVDGHAVVPRDYVATAVETLERTGAVNVGGVMAAVGTTPTEEAIAAAMTSPIGVGGESFHVGGGEGPALSVYLGAFRRDALDAVGRYDERYLRAQDWELNLRLREAGGTIWFTPAMRVEYRPRPTLRRLARQYFDYGTWRRKLVRANPSTVSLRYLAAPVAVLGIAAGLLVLAGGAVAALVGSWPAWTLVGLLPPVGYALLVTAGGLLAGRGLGLRARLTVPAAIATMHMAWGTGFLLSRGTE